ncbi:glycosyltransferase [Halovivax gelatinilyticus]|uniref:glycosyltransferase n=1 Tax=Halovivax gelatinilyticus TaxID=2961597 RepID=UPI0020CA4841|nr:glycosyltransferase [Halovivax gelatinilyticus]
MKILWLRPSKGDNISVRRERIAEELRERGYEIDIQDATGRDGLTAIRRALTGGYDVIAGNVRVGLYLGYPLSVVRRTPFLGDVSDPISDIDSLPGPLFRFFEWYEWQALKRADATVFVYESSLLEATERGITDAVKLPNAVTFDLFADPDVNAISESQTILESDGVDLEKPIAIYIGVLSPTYGIHELLDAADITPEWEFVFVGEGPLESTVADAATDRENVTYPGAFPYELMPGFLHHADIGFCFKDAEQPLKLKEYGAAGLPIVARRGELERWYDPDELRFVELEPTAISDVLAEFQSDRTQRQSYAAAGRSIAREVSWEDVADGYDRLFRRIGPTETTESG